MWCGLRMPSPEPIGEPAGITAAQPTSASRRASTGSSVVYGSTVKPSATSCSAAASSSTASGSRVRSSPITSSLTQSVSNASRASWASLTASVGGVAAGGVGQQPHPAPVEQVEQPPAAPAAVSTRRSATVTSSVPEARIACSSACRLAAPPVPRISREVKVSPARSSGHPGHPPCAAVEHLDPVAVAQRAWPASRPRGTTSPLSATATPPRRCAGERRRPGRATRAAPPVSSRPTR